MIAHELEADRPNQPASQLRLLVEASAALGASLDYETTLASIARVVVPRLACWCAVYVVDDDGSVRRIAAAHADPAKEELMQELLRRYPISADPSHPVRRAIATGQTIVTTPVPAPTVARFAVDAEHARILRTLGVTSAVIVPLIARGRTLGAMSFGPEVAQASAEPNDLTIVEELAARAALAIDNARLYAEAQAAVRVRDEFLATASHDLKIPLTAIAAQAQLLQRRAARGRPEDFASVPAGLDRIIAASARMAELINELLDVAQLQAGQELALTLRPIDLVELVRRVVDGHAQVAPSHRIAVDCPDAALVGAWDAFRLERVLDNLLANAVKYSPEGSEIAVSVAEEESEDRRWAVVAVRDHGIGIPPGELPHVFDRFRRATNATCRTGGRGIGLAGARQIVEQHGGTLTAESEEGVGSIFTVRLPLDPDATDV
jgi:signal transduction histidine kinase